MGDTPRNKFDEKVPKNWKPVEALEERKPGMAFSDRLWHWLFSLGGLALVGCGVAIFAYLRLGRLGALVCGIGTIVFVLGFPSDAQKKGYRE